MTAHRSSKISRFRYRIRLAVLVLFVFSARAPANDADIVTAVAVAGEATALPGSKVVETIFSGRPSRLEWLLESKAEWQGRVRLSILRILAASAVPIVEDTILPEAALRANDRMIVTNHFDVPDSSAPVRYIAKLWIDIDDRAVAIHSREFLAIPEDHLAQLRGIRLRFQDEAKRLERHGAFFEACGWIVDTSESALGERPADLTVSLPQMTPTAGKGATTIIYRDFAQSAASDGDRVVLSREDVDGTLLLAELSAEAWGSLPKSAPLQAFISALLDGGDPKGRKTRTRF